MLRPVFAAWRPPEPGFLGESVSGSLILTPTRRIHLSVLSLIGKLLGLRSRRSGAPARKPIRCRPALESLEDRLVPANISTSLVLGNLTLTDNGASNFTISQPAANVIRITPGDGTTINGLARVVTIQDVTGNLSVNL